MGLLQIFFLHFLLLQTMEVEALFPSNDKW